MQSSKNDLGPDREIGSWAYDCKYRIRDGKFEFQGDSWHKDSWCACLPIQQNWEEFVVGRNPQDSLAKQVAAEIGMVETANGKWIWQQKPQPKKEIPPQPFRGTFAFNWDASTKTLTPAAEKVEVKELTKDEKFDQFMMNEYGDRLKSICTYNEDLRGVVDALLRSALVYFHKNEWQFVTEDELKALEAEKATGLICEFNFGVGDVLIGSGKKYCWLASKEYALKNQSAIGGKTWMWHDYQWKKVKLIQEIRHEFV